MASSSHDQQLRQLVAEQAALRRVAVLVARGAPQQVVFDAVSREVSELMRTDTAGLLRLEDADQIRLISGYSPPELPPVPVGLRGHIDRFTASRDAILTGRPSRSDATLLNAEERTPELRSLSLQSAVAAPITVAGRVWGAIAIARRSQETLPPETEARLGEFAELAGQAIANAEAHRQLADSRARIVQAADEARRQIERNLHDGAQQRIVSLGLLLRVAEKAVGDNDRATELLRGASDELQLVAQELRELARGIHPAILSEHGLRPALEALVTRTPVPVTLETPGARLPAPIEATTYYVVAEALTNVVKYAQATSATVRVLPTGDRVVVEIRDDGVGGAAMDGDGGLRGLADRVEALDGMLRIESATGAGTLVTASIPL